MVNRKLEPDLAAANKFLSVLAPDGNCTLQTFDDNKLRAAENKKGLGYDPLAKVFQGLPDKHLQSLIDLQHQGAGVFVMVNAGNGLGRSNATVIKVRAHVLDLDGAPITPVLESELQPHILIESSSDKWHAYWLVDGCPLDKFKERQHALADKFQGDRSVCDLARVMRVPGFFHLKGEPFQTRLVTPSI